MARKIKTSKQNIYGIYTRSSIDTALLQKLGKALDFDFFSLYPAVSNSTKNKSTTISDEVVSLRKELTELREKYELLRALFEAKTGKKVPGTM
ncbi:MAG: hypothetical protein NT084_01155 [Bacteroidetes bacterium]|nr:hypothetical protein [Bacteroidota bacterium]